jgi:6-phosphogluconolactonase
MIIIFPNIEELNLFAAEKFVEIANQSIEKRGKFTVVLAGGSTPKSLYKLLSSEKFKDRLDWSKVFFFLGDERNVLPDNEESNFRMANENLFKPLAIRRFQVFYWNTELSDVEQIAKNYDALIQIFFGLDENEGVIDFDLVLLGMGDDGHTASLFPNTNALHETEKIAMANWVEKLNDWRFTLTFPAINNARNVIFLISGKNKAETVKEVLEGEFQPDKLPSQNVKPRGNLLFLLDKDAASLLDKL